MSLSTQIFILLVCLFAQSCKPQATLDTISSRLDSFISRLDFQDVILDKLLKKHDELNTKMETQQTMLQEQETKMETQQTMMQEVTRRLTSLETLMNSTHEELVSKFCKEEQSKLTMTTHINEIKYSNCKELLDSGVIQSGVYTITPEGFPGGVEVYCDQETAGGGWNVILRRQKHTRQVNFNKTFEEYASGFGDPNGELWIGNRVLHSMTGEEPFTLRVDAKNLEGESRTGIWHIFSVGSEDTQFILSVADYSSRSTLGDALWKPSSSSTSTSRLSANNMKFSTFDRDNDGYEGLCSTSFGHGAWWYNNCCGATPTAPFGERNGDYNIANWFYWESSSSWSAIAISEIQFLIRP